MTYFRGRAHGVVTATTLPTTPRSMITRIWHGWTTPDNADAYERLLLTTVFPGIAARALPGYHGVRLARRTVTHGGVTEVEFVTTMDFDSIEGVSVFAGADHETSVVPPAARALLERFDGRAAHYEVVVDARG